MDLTDDEISQLKTWLRVYQGARASGQIQDDRIKLPPQGIILGQTKVTGGSGNTNFLYNNNGIVGEQIPAGGSGGIVVQIDPFGAGAYTGGLSPDSPFNGPAPAHPNLGSWGVGSAQGFYAGAYITNDPGIGGTGNDHDRVVVRIKVPATGNYTTYINYGTGQNSAIVDISFNGGPVILTVDQYAAPGTGKVLWTTNIPLGTLTANTEYLLDYQINGKNVANIFGSYVVSISRVLVVGG